MKTLLIAIISLFSFGIAANADNDRVVTKNSLPAKAVQFMDSHFPGADILYVKEEREFRDRTFEVSFKSGVKLEFRKNGVWKEVDCRNVAVPSAIVPEKIASYIKLNYPAEKIVKIERDRHDYEIRLSNSLELTFNKRFKIVDIDN